MFLENNFYIDDNIYCEVYLPEKNCPLIIYAHSLGMSHTSAYEYFEHFLKRGIGCLTFDFRGGGYSSKSNGKTKDMSLITEADDICKIINHVKTWNYINQEKIVLLGTSQGGAASVLASSKMKEDICGLILLYPALLIPDVAHEYKSINDIPETQNFNGWIKVSKRYFTDVWNLNIFEIMHKFNKPVLIIHGTNDYIVDYNYSIRASENYSNSVLKLIPGAGHGFNGNDFKICMKYIFDYLDVVFK